MQYKKNVFGILILGLVVIVMGMYFLPLSEDSARNQSPQIPDKSVPNDIPIDYNKEANAHTTCGFLRRHIAFQWADSLST